MKNQNKVTYNLDCERVFDKWRRPRVPVWGIGHGPLVLDELPTPALLVVRQLVLQDRADFAFPPRSSIHHEPAHEDLSAYHVSVAFRGPEDEVALVLLARVGMCYAV